MDRLAKLGWLKGILALLLCAPLWGCAHAQREAGTGWFGARREPRADAFADEMDPDNDADSRRVASRISPRPTEANPQQETVEQREALAEVLNEIQHMQELQPEEQTELINALKASDPKLWPQLIQVFKASVAARQRQIAGSLPTGVPGSEMAPVEVAQHPRMERGLPQNPSQLLTPPSQEALVATTGTVAATMQPGTGMVGLTQPLPGYQTNQTMMQTPQVQVVGGPAQPQNVTQPAGGVVQPAGGIATTPNGQVLQATAVMPVATNPAALQPVPTQPMDFQQAISTAIAQLEQTTPAGDNSPEAIARQEQLRLLYLAAGRREDAAKPITGLPAAQQEFWTNTLYSLWTVRDTATTAEASKRAAQAAPHLSLALARLGEQSELVARNLAFCTEVRSYGVYKTFDQYTFEPGQEVLLYAEVDHFKSQETPEGFHTALKSSYEVYDAEGRRIAQQDFPITEEKCRNQRRDFFIRYFITLPTKELYDGKHTLRLTIEDTLAHKVGQASIDFTVQRKEK
jgi:hypothetical protein